MPPRPAARLAWPAALALLLALALAVLALAPRGDPDWFWHLAAGRWMAAHGRVPVTDPFSFTADATIWIAHEWGFERLIAALAPLLGEAGTAALWRVAVGGGALALVAAAALRAGGGAWSFAAFALAAGALAPMLSERPHLASLAGVAYLGWAAERWRAGRRAAAFAFPAVALAWANLHGGAVFGGALFAAWAAGAALEERRARLAVPVALSLAALLATPAGAELVVLALRPLLGDEMVSANPDWGPPTLSQPATWCAAALGLGWIAGLLARRRRPTPSELGPVLLALPFACTQSRALPLLAVLLAPLAARAAARETPEPSRAALAVPALFVLALGVVAVARPQPPLEAGFFPERTVACLREARPQGGRLLAVYHWGGYSIDRLWPAWRPFIDGRADAYPRDVHADYQAIAEAAPDALRRLEARGVDAVLWPTEGWSALPLALERAGWQAICRDDVGTAWAP